MSDIVLPISPRLEEALAKALAVGERVVIRLPGSGAEAFAVTGERCVFLREIPSRDIGEPPSLEIVEIPRERVRGASIVDLPGGTSLRVDADSPPEAEKRSIAFSVMDRPAFEAAAKTLGQTDETLETSEDRASGEEPVDAPGKCPKCGAAADERDQFCAACGHRLRERCGTCGAATVAGAVYCQDCGSKIEKTLPRCPGCGRSLLAYYWTFCPDCGQLVQSKCGRCGMSVLPQWIHCTSCGRKLGDEHVDVSARRFVPTHDVERMAQAGFAPETKADDAVALNARGQGLFEQNKTEEALALFQRAVELDPNVAVYHCNLGVAYDELDRDDEAADEYRKAMELDPNDVVSMLGLGYIYSEREDKEGAQRMWKRIVEIAPNSAEAEESRGNLEHMEEL